MGGLGLSIVASACSRGEASEGADDEPELVETVTTFSTPGDSTIYVEDDLWLALRHLPREHLERALQRLDSDQREGAAADFRAAQALLRLDAKDAVEQDRDALRNSARDLGMLAGRIERKDRVEQSEIRAIVREAHHALGRHDLSQAGEAWDRSKTVVARGYVMEAMEQARAGLRVGGRTVPESVQTLLDEAQAALDAPDADRSASGFRHAVDDVSTALSELHPPDGAGARATPGR